ncbi:MAG: LysR family transcriptional regulator [Oceanospirillaceae bacterium]|nr:LysR family transcriptional regulator [Oceanospirillaceae bacterium]MBT10653.1 LysR family transcriptional regulator [Oceanospirillaceae bacterium]|tara:strand:- start:12347 stop:13264 length:918 start_codon:yes stop_codon:yes gene_type:complete
MGRKKAALPGQLSDLDLRLLRVFRAVAESGGISAAELRLNLANSTISNYIADLESRLDMRLCERGRGGFSLTEQGRVVYEASNELFSAVDQFRSQINRSHQRLLGELHLACAEHLPGGPDSVMVKALRRFSELAPDVRVEISTLSSDDVTSAVLDKKADLGVTVLLQTFTELETLPLFDELMQLYCGEGHPLYGKAGVKTAELADYKFVESPRLMPGREVSPDVRLWNKQARAHHQEARAALILSGHYLGMLPEHMVRNWGYDQKLQPLLPERYSYANTYSAIHRRHPRNAEAVTLFCDCLLASV